MIVLYTPASAHTARELALYVSASFSTLPLRPRSAHAAVTNVFAWAMLSLDAYGCVATYRKPSGLSGSKSLNGSDASAARGGGFQDGSCSLAFPMPWMRMTRCTSGGCCGYRRSTCACENFSPGAGGGSLG